MNPTQNTQLFVRAHNIQHSPGLTRNSLLVRVSSHFYIKINFSFFVIVVVILVAIVDAIVVLRNYSNAGSHRAALAEIHRDSIRIIEIRSNERHQRHHQISSIWIYSGNDFRLRNWMDGVPSIAIELSGNENRPKKGFLDTFNGWATFPHPSHRLTNTSTEIRVDPMAKLWVAKGKYCKSTNTIDKITSERHL